MSQDFGGNARHANFSQFRSTRPFNSLFYSYFADRVISVRSRFVTLHACRDENLRALPPKRSDAIFLRSIRDNDIA